MRHLLMLSLLLLGSCWAVAQYDSSQKTTSSGGANQTMVEGCLSGSGGSYTLTDKNGNSFQLTGDTAKLSEHNGHEVKVTGTPSSASSSPSSSGAQGSMGQTSSSTQQTIEVSSVKHISKACKNGGMSH